MTVRIECLFPTAVGMTELPRPLTEAELNILLNQPMLQNFGNSKSQSTLVLDDPVLTDLRAWIQAQLDEYFTSVWKPSSAVCPRITHSWTNATATGQNHHMHAHPNSFISGTFYVQTRDDDRIYFYDTTYRQVQVRPSEFTQLNSFSWWLPAAQNGLLMWPSGLQHAVESKDTPGVRVSLSFNTWLQGDVGSEEWLTSLAL